MIKEGVKILIDKETRGNCTLGCSRIWIYHDVWMLNFLLM